MGTRIVFGSHSLTVVKMSGGNNVGVN
uniref:Uncharacterized protein n=1 Tax=Anguilla anguilla TaxID=7936 RepID=A0A0E9T755_ANGAN